MNDTSSLRAWAEIDLEAIRHNLRTAASIIGSEGNIMMVVKANAYGHGMEAVCRALETEDIAFWGVANADEARALKKIGTAKRIFILGPTFPQEREEIVVNDWCVFISTWEEARDFNRLAEKMGKSYRAHIGLNTGMGREGFLPALFCGAIPDKKQYPHLEFEGMGSHMPAADEDPVFSRSQIEEFELLHGKLSARFPFRFVHLANSAGVVAWKIPCANLVRPGLILYGHNPMGDNCPLDLKLTMRLKSRVTMVGELPEGHGVSYGRDYITPHPARVATVGIGYADGYPRQLSNQGAHVIIKGSRCPLLGRVTMDQIVVDISHLDNVQPGDEVELFGDNIRVEDVARQAGTIIWDIFTGMGNRVTRIYGMCGKQETPPAF